MSKDKLFLLGALFLAGCALRSTSAAPPTQTRVPEITPPIPTSTAETPDEPVIIDFGGKVVYTQLLFDDFESGSLHPAFEFSEWGDAAITREPNLVIEGEYSLRLSHNGFIKTDPDILPLEGNTTYLVEFDYRILDRVENGNFNMDFGFQTAGGDPANLETNISTFNMLQNADDQGSFTLGGKMGNAPNYWLGINSNESSSVVIDNLRVLRQDTRSLEYQPEYWENISSLPYPRLGRNMLGTTHWMAYGIGGEPAFSYSVNQIESRMAMFNVIDGTEMRSQTIDPGFTYRLRSMNPNIIISPQRTAQEQGYDLPLEPLYNDATEDIGYEFELGLADEWFVEDTNGNPVGDPDWVTIRKMNISEYCPVVNGQTFNDYLIDWVINVVMSNGQWDGIHFDNLFGHVNPHIPNRWNPAALDFDINRNGLRDETLAMLSEITRSAAISLLERLREEVGDLEIITGNSGSHPEIYLAQYVNGYLFECVNEAWDADGLVSMSEPGWRLALQEYFIMQAQNISPVINTLHGCGRTGSVVEPDREYFEPTEDNIQTYRFTMATTLLGDGFYDYVLYDGRSAPYWFDEYTVNQEGVAEEAPENKGYLGQPLSDAVELKSPEKTIWEQDFELGRMPSGVWAGSGTLVSQAPGDVIEGSGSLVLDNPDHTGWDSVSMNTNFNQVTFTPGETYVVQFDWRIIETVDFFAESFIGDGSNEVHHYQIPGVIAGDSGTAIFPTTLGTSGSYKLTISLAGGGKVAIDNIRISRGGAGPWRRDFENGFVLVNPLNKPYTFTLEELRGYLGRTGIRRILGTQAPEVNNGQPVGESLTLQPFDAIILLADHISQ